MLENQELEPRALALETWQMVPDEGIEPPTNHYEWSVMPFN